MNGTSSTSSASAFWKSCRGALATGVAGLGEEPAGFDEISAEPGLGRVAAGARRREGVRGELAAAQDAFDEIVAIHREGEGTADLAFVEERTRDVDAVEIS